MASAEEATDTGFSTMLCVLFALFAGVLSALAVVVVAYPDHLAEKRNKAMSSCASRCSAVSSIVLTLICGMAMMASTWYGPVSVSYPMMVSSTLVTNISLMGPVLRMKKFSKPQLVGTYVLAISVVGLIDIGAADASADQDAVAMLRTTPAIVASTMTLGAMLVSIVSTIWIQRSGSKASSRLVYVTFLTLSATSTAITNTLAKLIYTVGSVEARVVVIVAYFIIGAVTVFTGPMIAAAVDNGVFVPFDRCLTLIVNQVIGLFVWEDWRTIQLPLIYLCCHLIMLLGVYEISDLDVMDMFTARKKHSYLRKSQVTPAQLRASQASKVSTKGGVRSTMRATLFGPYPAPTELQERVETALSVASLTSNREEMPVIQEMLVERKEPAIKEAPPIKEDAIQLSVVYV